MSRRTNLGRKLRIEGLERRYLLAGDVTVKVYGGTLVLTGDNKDNFVIVSGTGTPGQLVVAGEPDLNAVSTNLRYNNTNQSSVTVNGITNIVVDLKDGDNGFGLTNATLRSTVDIRTGCGMDLIAIGDVTSLATVHFTIKPAQLPITGLVSIGGDLNIHTNGGNDTVDIGTATSVSMTGLRPLDGVVATGVSVRGTVNIDTGGGSDTVNIGAGNLVKLENVFTISPKTLVPAIAVSIRGDLNINTGLILIT